MSCNRAEFQSLRRSWWINIERQPQRIPTCDAEIVAVLPQVPGADVHSTGRSRGELMD